MLWVRVQGATSSPRHSVGGQGVVLSVVARIWREFIKAIGLIQDSKWVSSLEKYGDEGGMP